MGRLTEAFYILNNRLHRRDLGMISYLSPDEVHWLMNIRAQWMRNICKSVSIPKPKRRRGKIRPVGDIC